MEKKPAEVNALERFCWNQIKISMFKINTYKYTCKLHLKWQNSKIFFRKIKHLTFQQNKQLTIANQLEMINVKLSSCFYTLSKGRFFFLLWCHILCTVYLDLIYWIKYIFTWNNYNISIKYVYTCIYINISIHVHHYIYMLWLFSHNCTYSWRTLFAD